MGFILVLSVVIAAAVAQAKPEDVVVISRTIETVSVVLPKNATESLQQESLKDTVDQLTVLLAMLNDALKNKTTKPLGTEQKGNFPNPDDAPNSISITDSTQESIKESNIETTPSVISNVQSFYEECNRQTVSDLRLSTYVFNQDTKVAETSVFIHPNIAVISQKGLSPGKASIKVGREWRIVEDVQYESGSAFDALMWTNQVTRTSPICLADDGVALGDCHAEFWKMERPGQSPNYQKWEGFGIIRGEECQGGNTICVKECLPNNAAVFCQAPGEFKIFVGFAINCNQGKTRLADVADVRRWLHSMKELFME